MKSNSESTTLVMVGKWNRYILSAPWVAKNIFDYELEKTIIEISMGNDQPPRYTFNTIRFLATNNRVTLTCLNDDNGTLNQAENISRKLVTLLPYTPVVGLGYNFSYSEKANTELLRMFDLPYNDKYGDNQYVIKSYLIKREISYDDCVLNLQISQNEDNLKFDLNFNYPVNNASMVIDKPLELFIKNKFRGLKLLKEVYGIELEVQGETT